LNTALPGWWFQSLKRRKIWKSVADCRSSDETEETYVVHHQLLYIEHLALFPFVASFKRRFSGKIWKWSKPPSSFDFDL
jgi:hypothetical protein